jgi:hypothetical protein
MQWSEHEDIKTTGISSPPIPVTAPVGSAAPTHITYDGKDVEGAERGGDHHEEVASHRDFGRIMGEGQPTLLGIAAQDHHHQSRGIMSPAWLYLA